MQTQTRVTNGTTDVADILRQLGVEVKRVGEKEISARCPVHIKRVGKADQSPSWSMNAHNGLWLCHSCGARGTLSSLVAELTGEPDSIIAVHSFLVHAGLDRLNSEEVVEKRPEVDWKAFSAFAAPSDNRLRTRGIDRASASKHGIRFVRESQTWVLPIVSQHGELWGWQEKSPSKVRNYPQGVKKSETLFGLDTLSSSIGVLVESPLDVARISTVVDGCSGLSSFGAHVSKEQISLLANSVDLLIVALDNDAAGIASGKVLMRKLPAFRHGIKWLQYSHTDAKDIGDMGHEDIVTALSKASVFPWWSHV